MERKMDFWTIEISAKFKEKTEAERLQKAIIKSGESQQLAGQQLDGKEFMSGVDHVANAEVNLESVEGKNYEAELLGKFGNLLKKLENLILNSPILFLFILFRIVHPN